MRSGRKDESAPSVRSNGMRKNPDGRQDCSIIRNLEHSLNQQVSIIRSKHVGQVELNARWQKWPELPCQELPKTQSQGAGRSQSCNSERDTCQAPSDSDAGNVGSAGSKSGTTAGEAELESTRAISLLKGQECNRRQTVCNCSVVGVKPASMGKQDKASEMCSKSGVGSCGSTSRINPVSQGSVL